MTLHLCFCLNISTYGIHAIVSPNAKASILIKIVLPLGLKILMCCNNEINKLDNLPPGLQRLECSYDKLIQLDNLPPGLIKLYCRNNNFQYDFIPTLENIRTHNANKLALAN